MAVTEIKATIPVCSYGNIQPTITCENYEDGMKELLALATSLGSGASEFAKSINVSAQKDEATQSASQSLRKKVCFGDDCVYFDEDSHTYSTEDGRQLLSGSTFAHKFEKEFPRLPVAQKAAEKRGVDTQVILDGWDSKGEVSLMWGSTIHKAIETKIKFGEDVNDSYLKALVDDLMEQQGESEMFSEVFVCDKELGLCGFIDCLVHLDGKDCEIYDWKTGDIFKRTSLTDEAKELFPDLVQKTVSLYYLQLNFYRYILERKGYNVVGMKIWALSGEHWSPVEVPKMDITKALESVWEFKK